MEKEQKKKSKKKQLFFAIFIASYLKKYLTYTDDSFRNYKGVACLCVYQISNLYII